MVWQGLNLSSETNIVYCLQNRLRKITKWQYRAIAFIVGIVVME
jgi:hypothetical protein